MPVCARQRSGKWRVVECATGKLATNASGTPIDGGGFRSKARAVSQVNAVNLSERRAGRI